MQPVAALSAYTLPLWLPTYTRPPAIVGCASAPTSPGKPNAHFSFRRGTWAAVNPANAPSWRRVLDVFALQPFHRGPVSGLEKRPDAAVHMACAEGVVSNG